ncbi:hypothetical protein K0U00_17110, partial [Paenibacillus sepulcri]|nr:hypothetical protein [Paenibacillus sepulcri]
DGAAGSEVNAEAGSQPENGSNATTGQEGYPNRVVVRLGKQADIPVDSMIRVGEVEYELSVLNDTNE